MHWTWLLDQQAGCPTGLTGCPGVPFPRVARLRSLSSVLGVTQPPVTAAFQKVLLISLVHLAGPSRT